MNDEINKKDNLQDNPSDTTPAEPITKISRKEYNAQYYQQNKTAISERRKTKRLAQREEVNAAERERLAADPAAHQQRIEINRKMRKTRKERIATDPNEQIKHNDRNALRRQKHAERYATDPAYRAQRDEFNKKRREQRKLKEKKEKEGDEP